MRTSIPDLCGESELRYSKHMRNKIEDLGDWAEDRFALFCSQAGVVANKSNKDRTGWDYLIEFPQENSASAPPDLHKKEATARAQVKSNEKGRLKARLKLSNAHRFAASPDPCFVILAAATNGGEPVQFYAKHFWKDEIERTLKRLRESERKEKPTNQQWLNLTFTDADCHTDDLIDWMREIVTQDREQYSAEKQRLNRTLGYEEGGFVGNVTFATKDLQALIDHSIGITPKIEVHHIRMVEKRFGIESLNPLFDGKPDFASLQSHPSPCVVEIMGQDDIARRFDGSIYRPGLPNLPLELVKIRAVAGPIEVILSGTGHANINFKFTSDQKHEVVHLASCLAALWALTSGPTSISILFDGRDLSCSNTKGFNNDDAAFFSEAAVLANSLALVVEKADGPNPVLSVDEIYQNIESVVEFRKFTEPKNIGFTLQSNTDEVKSAFIDRLLLNATLDIAGWRFSVLTVFPLENDELVGGERKLHFGQAKIVRAIVDQRSVNDHLSMIEQEKERYTERHQEGVVTMRWGDTDNEHAVFVNGLPEG